MNGTGEQGTGGLEDARSGRASVRSRPIGVMLNEEDHLRIQDAFRLRLDQTYAEVDRLDAELG
jgi:protein-arginine kinase